MECPYCGVENRAGVRYCNNCGRSLGSPAQNQSQPAVAPAPAPITSSSLKPGSLLQHDRYIIKKVLGQGGMGAALLAEDSRLDDKRVVIKELISDNTDPTQLQEDVRNFKREVSTLVLIDHPLVPTVTDHFQEGSHYFMVQEYVEGENLEDHLERIKKPMEEREVLTYASQLLDILDYLEHQKPPIVHRDVKPANIIIGAKDKRAHLVDFGIARAEVARNAQKKQTSALGTPGYAPPEQYQGNADPRSDLYALAATMHHLLTNRDPREHAPFTYPPARSLNPKLTPDIAGVLAHALVNDITQRYQSAAEMKRDIDEILQKHFGTMGDTSTYILGTSGPMKAVQTPGVAAAAAPPPARKVQQPAPRSIPPTARSATPAPAPRQAPYRPVGMLAGQPVPARKNNVFFNFLLFVLVIVVISVIAYAGLGYLNGRKGTTTGSGTPSGPTATQPAPTLPPSISVNGLGAFPVTNSQNPEYIGVSDGSFAFDTNRPDGQSKKLAAERFTAKDTSAAVSLWRQAINQESNDAEVLIYQEDQNVLASGSLYVTLVVGTMLTGSSVTVGRDDLQGAYVAQKEFNTAAGSGVRLRLLIANAGSQATYATTVAQQIAKIAKADNTVVGVMGWPFSDYAHDAISDLAHAGIPMVSQTASSDTLNGISPYFFRVAPSNVGQGAAAAKYAAQKLHAKQVALFYDPANTYSSSLADDFSGPFLAGGGKIVIKEQYTVGKSGQLPGLLQDALSHSPDLIYFSGYSSDVAPLLTSLPTSGQFAQLQVLGGDALYELGGYNGSRTGFNRLHFTAFAYPDEWSYLGLGNRQPAFFNDYIQAFDPQQQHKGYGFTRPSNDTILSYDAMQALLEGCRRALTGGKQSTTGADLATALRSITGSRSIQGVSGQIAFGPDGNPLDKAIVVLVVNSGGFIQIESVQGHFLK
ncbi:MAG: ABC transporter substrate-binding protein [Ktedonobacteraceae bacterium]